MSAAPQDDDHEALVARFRDNRLSKQTPHLSAEVSAAFDQIVHPLLEKSSVSCRLIELYSASKRCVCTQVDGSNYIVFDHALLNCFERFDALDDPKIPPSLVAAGLQLAIAEASRNAQRLEFYAFYLRRALEVEPLLRRMPRKPDAAFRRYWLAAFVLCHEAAHALPENHETKLILAQSALLASSSLFDEQIAALTGKLDALLSDSTTPSPSQNAPGAEMDQWLAAADDLGLGEDTIYDVLEQVTTDPRFLDEIACDSFAVTGLQLALEAMRNASSEETCAGIITSALSTAYLGFLHYRLAGYFQDIASGADDDLAAEKVNPLKLKLLVEMTLRGNLVVQRLIEAARSLGGDRAAKNLRETFAVLQQEHTSRLFVPGDQLMARTMLDDAFRDKLRSMLVDDKIDLELLDRDPLAVWAKSDLLWQRLHD